MKRIFTDMLTRFNRFPEPAPVKNAGRVTIQVIYPVFSMYWAPTFASVMSF